MMSLLPEWSLPRVAWPKKESGSPEGPTTMPVPSSVIRLGPMSIDDACDACCFSYELIAGVFAFFLRMLLDFSSVASCIICILLRFLLQSCLSFVISGWLWLWDA